MIEISAATIAAITASASTLISSAVTLYITSHFNAKSARMTRQMEARERVSSKLLDEKKLAYQSILHLLVLTYRAAKSILAAAKTTTLSPIEFDSSTVANTLWRNLIDAWDDCNIEHDRHYLICSAEIIEIIHNAAKDIIEPLSMKDFGSAREARCIADIFNEATILFRSQAMSEIEDRPKHDFIGQSDVALLERIARDRENRKQDR